MKVLDLRKKGAKEVKNLPMLRGLPLIGRGSFAAVFDNGGSIMKLTADLHQFDFHTIGIDNPAFPRVLTNYGQVGEVGELPVFLLEMEKLQRIEPDSHARSFVESFVRQYHQAYPAHGAWASDTVCCAEALMNMADLPYFTGRLRSGLLDLAQFVLSKNCAADFHAGNFMLRDKQIVLNDPVADHYATVIW